MYRASTLCIFLQNSMCVIPRNQTQDLCVAGAMTCIGLTNRILGNIYVLTWNSVREAVKEGNKRCYYVNSITEAISKKSTTTAEVKHLSDN